MNKNREYLGIALVLAVTFCFATSNSLAAVAYGGGANALSVSTSRFVLPALILAGWLLAAGKPLLLARRDGIVAALLGLVAAAYTWALLSAFERLPVPLAVLIFFLFPAFTAILVAALGWQRLRPANAVAIAVAFAGLVLALGVSGAGIDLPGVVLGIGAALGLAVVSAVSSRVIHAGDSRGVTLYIVTVAAIAFAAISAFRGEFALPDTRTAWWGFVGTNLFFAAAMIGFFAAIALIGPIKTTLYSYVEPLLTMGTAFVLLGQLLAPLQIVGALVVVAALAFAGWSNLRGERAMAPAHST